MYMEVQYCVDDCVEKLQSFVYSSKRKETFPGKRENHMITLCHYEKGDIILHTIHLFRPEH